LCELKMYVCENYLPDYSKAIEREGLQNVSAEGFPCLCSYRLASVQVKERLVQMAGRGMDCVIFCGRFCAVLGLLPGSPNIKAIPLDYCFSHLATPSMIQTFLDEGGYVIGSGWLNDWEVRLRELGFDQKTARAFYREACKKLVYIDTGIDPVANEKLTRLSEYLAIPAVRIPYDLEGLRSFIKGFYVEWCRS